MKYGHQKTSSNTSLAFEWNWARFLVAQQNRINQIWMIVIWNIFVFTVVFKLSGTHYTQCINILLNKKKKLNRMVWIYEKLLWNASLFSTRNFKLVVKRCTIVPLNFGYGRNDGNKNKGLRSLQRTNESYEPSMVCISILPRAKLKAIFWKLDKVFRWTKLMFISWNKRLKFPMK